MESAVRSAPSSAWARNLSGSVARQIGGERHNRSEGSARFILGSLLLHALLVWAAISTSVVAGQELAAASLAPPLSVDIEFETVSTPAPPLQPREPELPQGRLDQPVVTTAAPSRLDRDPDPERHTTEPAAQAPRVLSAENPYATTGDNEVFTGGNPASKATTKVIARAASVGPHFGVESGSVNSDAEMTRLLHEWYMKVRAQLGQLAAQSYPKRAQKLGQQGTTKIQVRIDGSGRLLTATIASASGHSTLDHAALSGIRAVAQVAPPPSGAGPTSLTVPITFRLR
jgi:protein TonB